MLGIIIFWQLNNKFLFVFICRLLNKKMYFLRAGNVSYNISVFLIVFNTIIGTQ